jgi:peptidoglycan/LPS O-acetylase OafA/YrhL
MHLLGESPRDRGPAADPSRGPQGTRAARFEYVPALDGLRALAVVAVLLYHSGQPWARGGYLGVDAFFVLSGFLITSLLVSEWNRAGTICLRAFWLRRARRLLPALGLVMLGVALYAAAFAGTDELARIRADGLATVGYVANWRFVFSGQSYFDQFSQPSPLRHMWSLAIEEQFYLVWPLVVLGVLWWRRSLRVLFAITVTGAIGSAALMAILFDGHRDPSRVYYGTDTRAQAVLVGAAAGIFLLGRPAIRDVRARVLLQGAGICGAVFTLWLWWSASEASGAMYRGGFFAAALAVVAVIALVSDPTPSLLGRLLSWRPLRWVGAISYGLYLWHWPLYLTLTPGRVGLTGAPLLVIRLVVTCAFAAASYYAIEMPVRHGAFRGRAFRGRARWVTAPVAIGLVVVVLFGCTTGATNSVDLSHPPAPAPVPSVVLGTATAPAPVRVLVQGDSVAWFLGAAMLEDQSKSGLVVWNRARWGCPLGFGTTSRVGPEGGVPQCADWHKVFRNEVDRFRPDVVVLLSNAFDIFDRTVDGRLMKFGSAALDGYYRRWLGQATRLLASRGAHVVFLESPHPLRSDSLWETNPEWAPDQSWRTQHFNELLRDVAQTERATTSTIDLVPIVCPRDPCPDSVDGLVYRGDGVHWTSEGAAALAHWLDPQLRAIGEQHRGVDARSPSVSVSSVTGR